MNAVAKKFTLAYQLATGELTEIIKHKILIELCNKVETSHKEDRFLGNISPENVFVYIGAQ